MRTSWIGGKCHQWFEWFMWGNYYCSYIQEWTISYDDDDIVKLVDLGPLIRHYSSSNCIWWMEALCWKSSNIGETVAKTKETVATQDQKYSTLLTLAQRHWWMQFESKIGSRHISVEVCYSIVMLESLNELASDGPSLSGFNVVMGPSS